MWSAKYWPKQPNIRFRPEPESPDFRCNPHNRPELWRHFRFIQNTNISVSRFGDSHDSIAKRLIKRQPLTSPVKYGNPIKKARFQIKKASFYFKLTYCLRFQALERYYISMLRTAGSPEVIETISPLVVLLRYFFGIRLSKTSFYAKLFLNIAKLTGLLNATQRGDHRVEHVKKHPKTILVHVQ